MYFYILLIDLTFSNSMHLKTDVPIYICVRVCVCMCTYMYVCMCTSHR